MINMELILLILGIYSLVSGWRILNTKYGENLESTKDIDILLPNNKKENRDAAINNRRRYGIAGLVWGGIFIIVAVVGFLQK